MGTTCSTLGYRVPSGRIPRGRVPSGRVELRAGGRREVGIERPARVLGSPEAAGAPDERDAEPGEDPARRE